MQGYHLLSHNTVVSQILSEMQSSQDKDGSTTSHIYWLLWQHQIEWRKTFGQRRPEEDNIMLSEKEGMLVFGNFARSVPNISGTRDAIIPYLSCPQGDCKISVTRNTSFKFRPWFLPI